MFKKLSLIKVIIFCFLSAVLMSPNSFAKTWYEPELLGKPTVDLNGTGLREDAYALTKDGTRLYVLKEHKLFIFQTKPFKTIQVMDVPFERESKERPHFFRIWVTSDERFLNLVRRDKVIQFDLQEEKVNQTLVIENQEFYRSAFFNDELWLFCSDTSLHNHNLSPSYSGKTYVGPNPSSIKVFDAHSLKFKKDLNYLLGREFINSPADSVSQINDKIFWYQPYGFGVYGQNTAWLRVIDSNSYQEKLRILNLGKEYLNRNTPVLYSSHVSEIRDFYKSNDLQTVRFAGKHISYNLKTRQLKQLEDDFFKKNAIESLTTNSFESGYLNLSASVYFLKNKDLLVAYSRGLAIYNVKTKLFLRLFVDADGESILIDPKTGEFVASSGARKYLYFKQAEDEYLPITDEQYQQFSKIRIN